MISGGGYAAPFGYAFVASAAAPVKKFHCTKVVNASAKADVTRTREDRIKDSGATAAPKSFEATHPVVRTHPETVRKAFKLITEKKIKSTDYITGEAPLSRLQQVLRHMMNRSGDIKTAIIPGH